MKDNINKYFTKIYSNIKKISRQSLLLNMYLQKEIIPRLSQEILFDIREKNLIYINKKHIRVIEINIGLILLNIWSFNIIIDYDIYKIINKKKISL